MDVTTAARFHFGEMFFSTGFLSLTLLLLGVAPLTFALFFVVFEGGDLFSSIPTGGCQSVSNEFLNLVIVTPRMHGNSPFHCRT